MKAIDPAVSGLRAERPTLMSLGDDACRFRVWPPTIPWPPTPTGFSSAGSPASRHPADPPTPRCQGAEVSVLLQEMFWGDRHGEIFDPFGHRWGLDQHLREWAHPCR
jgi:hypothetical protein